MRLVSVAAVFALFAANAQALIIDYALNATFADSTTVTGTYRYDSIAQTGSNYDFELSAFPGQTFTQPVAAGALATTFEFGVLDPADGVIFFGDPLFDIDVSINGDLLMPNFSGVYGTCNVNDCGSFNATSSITSGTLTGVVVADVPLPASAILLAAGLAVLGARARLRLGA